MEAWPLSLRSSPLRESHIEILHGLRGELKVGERAIIGAGSTEQEVFDALWAGDWQKAVSLVESAIRNGDKINLNAIDSRSRKDEHIPKRSMLGVAAANQKDVPFIEFLLSISRNKQSGKLEIVKSIPDEFGSPNYVADLPDSPNEPAVDINDGSVLEAVATGNVEAVLLFKKYNANFNMKNDYGLSAYNLASSSILGMLPKREEKQEPVNKPATLSRLLRMGEKVFKEGEEKAKKMRSLL